MSGLIEWGGGGQDVCRNEAGQALYRPTVCMQSANNISTSKDKQSRERRANRILASLITFLKYFNWKFKPHNIKYVYIQQILFKKKNLGNVFVITKYAGTDRENTETENPDS